MRFLRPNFTYANVMSTVAVALLLTGGTAFAATKLITGAGIQNGTVTSADLANGKLGVQSVDVKDGSLDVTDLSVAARAALKGASGATGGAGPQGPPGIQGVQGAPESTTKYAAVAGALAITGPSFGNNAGSPSITVDVPANGLLQVFASATVTNNAAAGYMMASVVIDGGVGKEFLRSAPGSVTPASGTTYSFAGYSAAVSGAPQSYGGSPITFLLAPGSHTVTIMRQSNDFGFTGVITNQRLWVTVVTPS